MSETWAELIAKVGLDARKGAPTEAAADIAAEAAMSAARDKRDDLLQLVRNRLQEIKS